jgi:hypothetical protein
MRDGEGNGSAKNRENPPQKQHNVSYGRRTATRTGRRRAAEARESLPQKEFQETVPAET